jgi:NhaP-type Na+/H+ or K+/H+ antiporter
VLFGGALTSGLLSDLRSEGVVLVAALISVLRPVATLLGLVGCALPTEERWAISSFGIRGIGSPYELAYALDEAEFSGADVVWSTVAFTVVCSIVVHGITATPAMPRGDRSLYRVNPPLLPSRPVNSPESRAAGIGVRRGCPGVCRRRSCVRSGAGFGCHLPGG